MFGFKPGVKINGIKPELVFANQVVSSVFHHFGYSCQCTSGLEGKHSKKSKHYTGYGADYGIKHVKPDDVEKVYNMICEQLTDEFDIVLETTHIHVEFDPVFN